MDYRPKGGVLAWIHSHRGDVGAAPPSSSLRPTNHMGHTSVTSVYRILARSKKNRAAHWWLVSLGLRSVWIRPPPTTAECMGL